jgi:hypothetical protein
MSHNQVKRALVFSLKLFFIIHIILPGVSSATDFTPIYKPTLNIPKLSGTIEIDGILDDNGWQQAAIASNFAEHQPGDQVQPRVETKVLITYDDENIYVAFQAYDDPAKVRASLCNRERIFNDDNVGFFIDTYGDATWAYILNVNPYGIQYDALWSNNSGEDSGFDLIWKSDGQVTDFGFQVELAVPFSSLRFPNSGTQTWRVDFWRNHPRETDRQYSWAAYDRDESCWPCQWGTITGIQGVQPGKGIEIYPSIITYQLGEMENDSTFNNEKADGEMSLSAKYGISSNVTAEITYNPDFSQIEADAAQIDVNSVTALSYAERRPFFQEGSDLFQMTFWTVYTRSINDPQFAAKLTGRLGRTSFAYLGARDELTPILIPLEQRSAFVVAGKSVSNILRIRQTVSDNSYIGALISNRWLDDGGNNTQLSFDGSLRLSKTFSTLWQYIATYSEEPNDTMMTSRLIPYYGEYFNDGAHTVHYDGENYWGNAAYFQIERADRHSRINLAYLEKSPTFRADMGYQPTNDRRKTQFLTGYTFYFNNSFIDRISPTVTIAREWNYRGEINEQYIWAEADIRMNFLALSTHPRYERYTRRYLGVEYNDIWKIHWCLHSTCTDWLSAGGAVNYGHQIAYGPEIMGKETSLYGWFDLRPTDRLLIENSFSYTRSDSLKGGGEIYTQFIAYSRLNFQYNRELSLRLVIQHDDYRRVWDIDPLITYQINPFSALYAGSSHCYRECDIDGSPVNDRQWKLDSRQFFIKLKYLFRI